MTPENPEGLVYIIKCKKKTTKKGQLSIFDRFILTLSDNCVFQIYASAPVTPGKVILTQIILAQISKTRGPK